jgi:hypothetical protein
LPCSTTMPVVLRVLGLPGQCEAPGWPRRGGALYDRVRSEALSLGVKGLFYECLPDDPALCRDPAILKQNRARLRFYERYGARPSRHGLRNAGQGRRRQSAIPGL